jgi:Glucose / Sorbosone dehydrogenase/PKD domain
MVTAIPMVILPVTAASAQPALKPGFNIATFTDLGEPVSGGVTNFAYLPSGKILAVSKTGFIGVGPQPGTPGAWTRLMINGGPNALPNLNSDGDRGLSGLALSLDFGTSGKIYVLYNVVNGANGFNCGGPVCGRLSSFLLDDANNPTAVVPGSETVIIPDFPSYSINAPGNGDNSHTVGTVIVAPDGTLFVGNGDASSYNIADNTSFQAQSLASPRGKILHVNTDGSGVGSNPYYQPGAPSSWQSRVFTYGQRNPYRFQLKPGTNSTLYIGDVGSGGREEIDIAKGGENFGWPCYEGELSYHQNSFAGTATCVNAYNGTAPFPNLTAPIWSYEHFAGVGGNAVIGGTFAPDPGNYGSYNGAYFFGDNPAQRMWTLRTDANDAPTSLPQGSGDFFGDDIGFPTAYHVAPNGNIAYSDIGANRIYEIRFGCPGGNCPPVVQATVTPIAGPPGTTFTFDASQSYDPEGNNPLSYNWDFGDNSPHGSGVTTTHVYPPGVRQKWPATVTVTDSLGKSDTANVAVSTEHAPPSITITPNKPGTYSVGEGVGLTATATGFNGADAAYPIGGTDIKWQVFIHHCPPIAGGCHLHPNTPSPQPFGNSFNTIVPDHGDDSYLEFKATATDADSLSTTVSFNLPMSRHALLVGSNVPGTPITVNANLVPAPVSAAAITNSGNQLIAPASSAGLPFVGWSDGSTDTTKRFTMPDSDVSISACYGGPCSAGGAPGLYTPVQPYRLFDTRAAATSPTGTDAPLAPGQTMAVDLSNQPGAPAGKTAVLLNVTTDQPQAAGYVKAFPCGGTEPYISTVNFDPGQTAANLAMVRLPADGKVCFTSFVPTHVIVDVSGWFAPASGGGSAYTTVDPYRVLDTRETGQTLAPQQEFRLSLAGQPGFPADATAALINLTATNTVAPGYVRAYPCGEEQDVSNVNYAAGQTVANLASVKVAAGGDICFKSYAQTDIVVDLAGWYAPGGGGQFAAADPTRVFDTRSTPGFTKLAADQELAIQLTGAVVPPGATSVALNVTAAAPDAAGYVAVYPCGTSPFISNVNYRAGQVAAANLAVVKIPADGRVCFKSFAPTDLVVDLAGWYIG